MIEGNEGLPNSAANGNASDGSLSGTSSGSADGNQGATNDNPTPEQLLQKERTRFGREKSELQRKIDDLEGRISAITATSANSVPISDEPPVQYISTPEELEKYNEWKNARDEKKRKAYAIQYVGAVKVLNYINPELHAEIENELLYSNTRYSSPSKFADPTEDALANYSKAEAAVLKRKLVEMKNRSGVIRGGTGQATGVTATSDNAGGTGKKIVALDEDAKKFVKAMGLAEDSDEVQNSVQRQDL